MSRPISTLNILGVSYDVIVETPEENSKLRNADGLCEIFAKQLIINDSDRHDVDAWSNMNEYYQKVLRHEIFHAILAECGASKYYEDEDLVELLALLYPRIEKIMHEAKKIGDKINAV